MYFCMQTSFAFAYTIIQQDQTAMMLPIWLHISVFVFYKNVCLIA